MKPDFVFEVASEAGRKVGGIYTVLKTKAPAAIENFDDSYFLFGYYDTHSAKDELDEEVPPKGIWQVFEALRKEGIICHYGRWNQGGNAKLILVDAWDYGRRDVEVPYGSGKDSALNAIKYNLWKRWGIDSLFMGMDFSENVLWATAVGKLIESMLEAEPFKGRNVVGQFHEWISGAALLHLKEANSHIATVFTTHATVLGRSKTTFGENLMRTVHAGLRSGKVAPADEAYKFKLEGKHLMEVACAKNADAFTTVSDTVAAEVEYILGKKPDVVTLNGINFAGGEGSEWAENPKRRESNREEIENLINAMFLPQERPRTKNALFVYISSRYEFENKGIDLFIDAMGVINKQLKERSRPIYGFIFVPSNVSGPNKTITENLLMTDRMRELAYEIEGKRIPMDDLLALMEKDPKKWKDLVKLQKNFISFPQPPLCCFDLNYGNDAVLNRLGQNGLTNSKGSRVKMIFYPTYLKAGDGLLNTEYEQIVSATDIGVFPSRYEPFGYTPAEAARANSIAITTDSSGFGKFMTVKFGDTSERGIMVVETEGKTDEEIVKQITLLIDSIASASDEKLSALKKDASGMIKVLDWKVQIQNYVAAYDIALSKRFGAIFSAAAGKQKK